MFWFIGSNRIFYALSGSQEVSGLIISVLFKKSFDFPSNNLAM